MNRPRTPLALTFVAGSLLAGLVGFLVLLSASSTTGCSTVETTPAPDATLPPCDPGPFVFCQPIEDETQPNCFTDDNSSPILQKARRATRYPVGCVIDFVGPRDEQGDCRLESVCKCVIGDLPGTPQPQPEAGTPIDAGPDADPDAAPPPPPPTPDAGPTTGPIWQCG